jgi:hypothetical protein
VLDGQVNPVGEALSDADRAAGYVLSCIAHPIGDVTLQSGGSGPGGVGGAAHAGTRSLVRLGAFVGVSALLMTSWNLTNHRPTSWAQASAASSTSGTTVTTGSTASLSATAGAPGAAQATATPGTPGATTSPTSAPTGSNPQPTAKPQPGVTPPPAATPQPGATPQPTAKPKPTPVATATPSKPA